MSKSIKGFWKHGDTKKSYARICSVCGEKSYFVGDGNYPYCPYCKAEMIAIGRDYAPTKEQYPTTVVVVNGKKREYAIKHDFSGNVYYEEIHKMKVVVEDWAYMPEKAHKTDAGLDIRSPKSAVIYGHDSVTIDTGIHIEIPNGYVGFLKSKSGLNVNHGIQSEGVIDCGYTGSIKVKLYNNSSNMYAVERGDKISQLVILPILAPEIELVESLEDTERGDNGFGSTGK